jgi:hypothetical protein
MAASRAGDAGDGWWRDDRNLVHLRIEDDSRPHVIQMH